MRWFTKHLWKVGMACASTLFLLSCLALIPPSAVSAHEGTSAVATLTTVTVQATPTIDTTVTALNKEQLAQQVAGQQHTLGNWLWSNAATVLSSFLSTLVVVIGVLFGFWQWRVGRMDTQKKESDDRKAAQDKELEDRKAERERRDEEQQRWLKIRKLNERNVRRSAFSLL
jgi:type VI protein secretion system component VasK